jgi:uncharacterized protein
VDLTPIIPGDRQVIDGYGRDRFRVSGVDHEGSVLVFPEATLAWGPACMAEVSLASLRPVVDKGGVEILLLGCGARMAPVPSELRQALRDAGIVVDAMDTGAACRTYNVLLSEERRVAAALLPIGA